MIDPVLDGGGLALARVSRRSLQGPVHRAQHLPHMARMIPHAGQPRDDVRHPRECPQIGVEPVRPRPAAQRDVEASELLAIEPRFAAGAPRAAQAGRALAPPCAIPACDTLPAHLQASSDRRKEQLATGEQPRRVPAPLRQGLKIPSGRKVGLHPSIVATACGVVTVLCETH